MSETGVNTTHEPQGEESTRDLLRDYQELRRLKVPPDSPAWDNWLERLSQKPQARRARLLSLIELGTEFQAGVTQVLTEMNAFEDPTRFVARLKEIMFRKLPDE